jgi:hypothetical protein
MKSGDQCFDGTEDKREKKEENPQFVVEQLFMNF